MILQNFIARPLKDAAGIEDLLSWECAIPGPTKVLESLIVFCDFWNYLFISDN